MGIKPTSGDHVVIPPDNTQSRWGDWEAELDDKGEVAGEVITETWALANSANTWITGNSTPLYDGISGALDEARIAYEQAEEAWEEAVKARDDAQDEAIKLLAEVQDLQTQQSVRMLTAVPGGGTVSDGRIQLYVQNGRWYVGKIGNWVGSGVFHGANTTRYYVSFDGQRSSIDALTPVVFPIDFLSVGSSWDTGAISSENAVIYYTVQHGVAKQDKREIGSSVMTNAWTTLDTFTAPASKDTRLTGRFRVTWNAADRGVYYGIRIVVNGSVLKSEYLNGLGPLLPFIGSGVISRSLMLDDNIPAGATVEFQARANGGGTSQRTMRGAVIELGWVE